MGQDNGQSVFFEGVFSKPVVAAFDGEALSSDGGLVLLGAVDRRLRLTERLAACLTDRRDASKVEHAYLELFRQRVFAMAAGYEDQNDAARTGRDPVLKGLCGLPALGEEALGSQPTLSRFERSQSGRDLVKLARRFETLTIERHRKRLGGGVRLVTIDLDPTDDPTHGQQPFAFYNGHYETWCYLPLLGFLTFDNEPDQHLFLARLRPGNASATRAAIPALRRAIVQIRAEFPKARIRVRLDGGFASPRLLDFLDKMADEYTVAMPANARLLELADEYMCCARSVGEYTGETAAVFGDFQYATEKTWPHERRVVVKAEQTRLKGHDPVDNPRFVVTKLPRKSAEQAYGVYAGRGDVENRIKELHHGLSVDRTSSTSFLANQLRVLIAATAYVLFEELRGALPTTSEVSRFQVSTIRDHFLKIGARVVESVRRVVLHFPAAYPWAESWKLLARAVGAT